MENKVENKKVNMVAIKIFKFCMITSLILLPIAMIGSCGNEEGKKVEKVEVEKTAAEIRQENIQKLFSAWDGSNINLVVYVKNNMNDPKSFEHVETLYKDLGDNIMVSMEFRGKNAFGGVVKNKVVALLDINGNILEVANAD